MELRLNEIEESFLRQYASVYEEERKRDATADPIVLVQDEKKIYVSADSYSGKEYELIVNGESLNEDGLFPEFKVLAEAMNEKLEQYGLDSEKIEAMIDDVRLEIDGFYSYSEWEHEDEEVCVQVKAYYYDKYFDTVAYFFTIEEARKYIEYQGHNLRSPRIYTAYAGYNNNGDYPVFQSLLLRLGRELLEEDRERGV